MKITIEEQMTGHNEVHRNLVFSVGSYDEGVASIRVFDIDNEKMKDIITQLLVLQKENFKLGEIKYV